MIPLTPRFLIAAAASLDGLRDSRGSNLSVMMARLAAKLPHAEADPSALFVLYAGYSAHLDPDTRQSSWPVPMIASCKRLGEFARRAGILDEEPLEGDVFLLFDPAKAGFTRAGIVAALKERSVSPAGRPRFDCHTIEWVGDTDGSERAPSVIRNLRRFYPDVGDRFIRWAALDVRDARNSDAAA